MEFTDDYQAFDYIQDRSAAFLRVPRRSGTAMNLLSDGTFKQYLRVCKSQNSVLDLLAWVSSEVRQATEGPPDGSGRPLTP